jgi:hypothetical protein
MFYQFATFEVLPCFFGSRALLASRMLLCPRMAERLVLLKVGTTFLASFSTLDKSLLLLLKSLYIIAKIIM